jgi:ABC-2 type transport system permease protein
MRKLWTIATKDFRGYLSSPAFYIVAALFTVFLGFTFAMLLEHFNQRSMHFIIPGQNRGEGLNLHNEVFVGLISAMNLAFIFLVPVLAVRQLTEEKKTKAFDLLLTSPVTAWQIAIGKYLAAYMAVCLLIGMSFLYPLGLSLVMEIQWSSLASAYIGLFLLSGVYVGVGLFAASLTESFFAAYGIAFLLVLGSWFVAWVRVIIDDAFWGQIMNYVSIGQHFEEFGKGQISLGAIAFFLSLIMFFIFLSDRVIESSRWR